MCDLPTPARPTSSTFSLRSTKPHVARSMIFDFGIFRIEVEVEVLDRARAVEARASNAHVELLTAATLDLVGEQPEQKLGIRVIVFSRLPRSQLDRHARPTPGHRAARHRRTCSPSAAVLSCDWRLDTPAACAKASPVQLFVFHLSSLRSTRGLVGANASQKREIYKWTPFVGSKTGLRPFSSHSLPTPRRSRESLPSFVRATTPPFRGPSTLLPSSPDTRTGRQCSTLPMSSVGWSSR